MPNTMQLHGKVNKQATVKLVKTAFGEEQPLVIFTVQDPGLPGSSSKDKPLFLEVHFIKDVAMNIVDFLVPGKEVYIVGTLDCKTYEKNGQTCFKYFCKADYVTLLPMFKGVE